MAIADPALESIFCRAALAGDRIAWQRLYDAAATPLGQYARWRCGGKADLAEDALQDAWLTIAKMLRKFDPKRGSFLNWSRAIVANAVRNRLRSRQRSNARAGPLDGTETTTASSDEYAVAEALATLSDDYETVLRLKYLESRSVQEISSMTGEPETTIESRLTRAREAFRKAYGDER